MLARLCWQAQHSLAALHGAVGALELLPELLAAHGAGLPWHGAVPHSRAAASIAAFYCSLKLSLDVLASEHADVRSLTGWSFSVLGWEELLRVFEGFRGVLGVSKQGCFWFVSGQCGRICWPNISYTQTVVFFFLLYLFTYLFNVFKPLQNEPSARRHAPQVVIFPFVTEQQTKTVTFYNVKNDDGNLEVEILLRLLNGCLVVCIPVQSVFDKC